MRVVLYSHYISQKHAVEMCSMPVGVKLCGAKLASNLTQFQYAYSMLDVYKQLYFNIKDWSLSLELSKLYQIINI
jgi:hypothetical protein